MAYSALQNLVFVFALLCKDRGDPAPLLSASNFTQSVAFRLHPDTSYIAPCRYSLSGNYGRLSRVLSFSTTVFGLFTSRLKKPVSGALTATLTYSGTTAIGLLRYDCYKYTEHLVRHNGTFDESVSYFMNLRVG